jgi:pyruvate kinase
MITRIDGKRTKIVATIGPRSYAEDTLRRMIRAGMDVARINFSHGEHATHGKAIDDVRRIAAEENAVVAILCDIQGPKIRIGKIASEPLVLAPGDRITLTTEPADGTNNVVSLPHPEFMKDIKPGAHLLLDDGKYEFVVKVATGTSAICDVLIGGDLTSRKGVMAKNARLTLSAITDKDREDIAFALGKRAEYIAMSFVRSENDIREMRWLIKHNGGDASIIAKIEKHEALEVIESIVAATDGIMVARGDMGVEISPEEVPFHQKRIIRLCNEAGKPVITATQMLLSMVDSPRPTRAEASDVYNAILDGTDAVMLSNETANGNYPVESVEMMVNIAAIAEQNFPKRPEATPTAGARFQEGAEHTSDAVSASTGAIADMLGCKAIITATLSGYTTRRVAKARPRTPIICVTPNETTYRRMALVWGVVPVMVPMFNTIDEMLGTVVRAVHQQKLIDLGDQVVIIAGVPFGAAGQTNFIKVHVAGEAGELDTEGS